MSDTTLAAAVSPGPVVRQGFKGVGGPAHKDTAAATSSSAIARVETEPRIKNFPPVADATIGSLPSAQVDYQSTTKLLATMIPLQAQLKMPGEN